VVGGVPIALILHPQNRCFKYYLVLWKTVRYPHFVVFILFVDHCFLQEELIQNAKSTLYLSYFW
jgi:hypothetical protein